MMSRTVSSSVGSNVDQPSTLCRQKVMHDLDLARYIQRRGVAATFDFDDARTRSGVVIALRLEPEREQSGLKRGSGTRDIADVLPGEP